MHMPIYSISEYNLQLSRALLFTSFILLINDEETYVTLSYTAFVSLVFTW